MYFVKLNGNVCHLLEDLNSGQAPRPCGAKIERVFLRHFLAGRPTAHIMSEKPENMPFCKHCQKAEAESSMAARQ